MEQFITDDAIQKNAIEFARKNRKRIAQERTDIKKYRPDESPVSVFMAGSPSAGKTEFSKNIITILEKNRDHQVVRIDGDEIRHDLPGYKGNNSYLFQGAVSLIVEKIHDFVLSQKQSFVLDGTFSRYKKATDNINRSLSKVRKVYIFYVYQYPATAWYLHGNEKRPRGVIYRRILLLNSFWEQGKQ